MTEAAPDPSSENTRRRRFLVVGVAVLLGAVGGLGALALAPPVSGAIGPGQVEMSLRTALSGRTEIGLPPLGDIEAATHSAPSVISADVQSVDIAQLQDLLLAQQPTQAFVEVAERDADRLVRRVALMCLGVGALGGAGLGALVWHLRWRRLALTATGGLVAVGALLGLTWRTFDAEAFSQPTYSGALVRAPAVIETIGRHVDSFSAVRKRVDTLGHQLADLYAVAFAAPARPGTSGTRILHVSDIHSNPLAMEIVDQLADTFDPHAVLDTGDLTSFGLPVEARIADQIEGIDVPYLYVPGNHDSAANRRAISLADGVELLDGRVVEVRDVRILGMPDPTFTATHETTGPEGERINAERAGDAARMVQRHDPDVLAVHNAFLAGESFGEVPLIVNGHRHERATEQRDGTIRLAIGSTGASGIGFFTVETDQPFEAQLLTFRRGCLVTQDYLRVWGIGGDLQIERRTWDLTDDPDDDEPACIPRVEGDQPRANPLDGPVPR